MVRQQQQALPVIAGLVTLIILGSAYGLVIQLITGRSAPFPTTVGAAGAIYLLFCFDLAPLLYNYYMQYPDWRRRLAIQLGSAVGTWISMSLLFVVWHLLSPFEALRLAAMVFAALMLCRVAALAIRKLNPYDQPLALMWRILTPINRFFGPVLRPIVPEPVTRVPNGLVPHTLVLATAALSLTTMHEYTAFLTMNQMLDVFGFGLGVLTANVLVNLGVQLYPDQLLRLLRHPTFTIMSGVFFFVFIGLMLYQSWLMLTT